MTACTWVLSAYTHPDTQSTTYSPFIGITQETLTAVLSGHTNISNAYKVLDSHGHTHTENTQLKGSLCPSHEEVVYSGDAGVYTFTGNS